MPSLHRPYFYATKRETEGYQYIMIFVTVGTHEQQFNRLVKCIDELKAKNDILDEVFIQTGFSMYEPKYCSWSKLLPYKRMMEYVEKASIVITHGGPSSIMMPLQIGKIPIVVPRQKQYGEHVNNHQVEFVKKIEKNNNILPIYDIQKLKNYIFDYDKFINAMDINISGNNNNFNKKLENIIARII
jgi:UDP-N-acetylglucosamine transferase subunit ALG13